MYLIIKILNIHKIDLVSTRMPLYKGSLIIISEISKLTVLDFTKLGSSKAGSTIKILLRYSVVEEILI